MTREKLLEIAQLLMSTNEFIDANIQLQVPIEIVAIIVNNDLIDISIRFKSNAYIEIRALDKCLINISIKHDGDDVPYFVCDYFYNKLIFNKSNLNKLIEIIVQQQKELIPFLANEKRWINPNEQIINAAKEASLFV